MIPICPTVALPSPQERHSGLVYANHPGLGDYIFSDSIKSWIHTRATASGSTFRVMGRGRYPSDVQLALWIETESRLPMLIETSLPTIKPPAEKTEDYRSESLALREVRFELNGTVMLFFDAPPYSDDNYLWPLVTFSSWKIVSSTWTC